MKTGMTSVTFREKSVEEVVSITKEANLTGIEWGGDVHVPAGDLPAAEKAAALCREAGLSVLSYGSYFHADEGEDFSPVLASAKALGAPVIRIWAGRKTYEESTPEEFSALASRIREAAKAAAEADIRVGFEFHRRTATQTKEGAVALLKAVNQPNVGCYWQPNPDVTFEEQLAEIRVLAPWLMNVHVFNWSAGNEAHLLEEGKETWLSYLSEIQKAPGRHDLILEFVKDGKDEAFRSDAAALKAWVKKPAAVFVCDYPENVHNVYDSHTMAILNNALELPETIVSSETLEENRAILEPAEYLFSTWGMPALTEEQLAKYLPNLKAAFYSAGSVQHFARPFLKRGIRVFSAWAANAIPVAEYAVAQIILAGKGFYQGLRIQDKEGRQAGSDYNRSFPCNYRTKVGILGAGMIGSHVCQLLKSYDLDVLVYDPFASDEKLAGLNAKRATLEEIFSECQTISCHIANLPTTKGMLKYEHFSRMKENATFINTGRGAQVVEADLIRALKEVPTRTALLDVTFPEPPEADSPFWTMQNVFLTPHIAGSMGKEVARMGSYMAEDFTRVLNREAPKWEVTLKMLETMA